MPRPKLSICIPIHDMQNGGYFLWRSINALMSQTFQDFEIVITKNGKMAENTNAAMRKAKGEIIKVLYLDDYLAHPQALQNLVDAFTEETKWLATGCVHQSGNEQFHSPHYPKWTSDIMAGNNQIGSPSVMAFRNEGHLAFDEKLSWLLDCDLYQRYHDTFGPPKLLNSLDVVMGLGAHQMTHLLTPEEKQSEHNYLLTKVQ